MSGALLVGAGGDRSLIVGDGLAALAVLSYDGSHDEEEGERCVLNEYVPSRHLALAPCGGLSDWVGREMQSPSEFSYSFAEQLWAKTTGPSGTGDCVGDAVAVAVVPAIAAAVAAAMSSLRIIKPPS